MKKIHLSLSFFLFCYSCFSQNAYYDALKLRSYVSVNQTGAIFSRAYEPKVDSILSKYAYGAFANEKIREYYRDRPTPNPFLKDLIPSDWPSSDNSKIRTSLIGNFSLSSLGSLNVTNLADGLAQFLIERGKEELNVAFFNRLKKFLDSTEECRVLFPQSIEVFKSIKPFEYSEFIKSLREAFQKDLGNLIISLNELIELPKYKRFLKEFPEIRLAIRSSKIVQELSQSDGGILPDSIITQLAALKEWGEINVNLGNSWKLLDVISQSVRYVPQDKIVSDTINNDKIIIDTLIKDKIDTLIRITIQNNRRVRDTTFQTMQNGDTTVNNRLIKNRVIQTALKKDTVTRRWIRLSDMNDLIKDPITLKIFLGLVYQKVDTIYFKIKKDSISVQDFMRMNADNILAVSSLIENFVNLANDLDRSIKDFRDKQKTNLLSNEDYYTYINKAINITEYGFRAANTIYKFKIQNQNKPDLLDNRYIEIAKSGNELYRSIYSKNYNNAIVSVHNILDLTFNHKKELIEEKNESYNLDSAGKANLNNVVNSTAFTSGKTIESILKYGNFMASVVQADSGEDVQKALEAAALPAGSYSIKQKSELNISVNGYIGYAWDYNSNLKHAYSKGIYAPVGVNITRGSIKKHGLTFTGFLSLLDVGSVAAYRIQNDTTEKLKQEVRLESIFSPSAQLAIEVGGYPFAFTAGWRRTPKLFYSSNTSFIPVSPKNVFNLSVLIDIPIFAIYNKRFEKK